MIREKLNLYILLLTKGLPQCMKTFKNCTSIIYSYLINGRNINSDKTIEVVFKNNVRAKLPFYAITVILGLPILGFPIDPYKFSIKNDKLYYDEREVLLDDFSSVLLSLAGWVKKDGLWIYNNIKIKNYENQKYNFLFGTFNLLEYGYFDVKDREVLDIGASIGDTPIFFALKGAKKVYAFEPLPLAYQQMLENIKLNNLEDKIEAINAGIGIKEGKLKVPSNTIDASFQPTGVGDVEVPIYPIDNVIDKVKDPYLLKMDCEGCEAEIILNSKKIHRFENIVFEHHAYITKVRVEKLIEKLADYKCFAKPLAPFISKKDLGLVYCNKIKNNP